MVLTLATSDSKKQTEPLLNEARSNLSAAWVLPEGPHSVISGSLSHCLFHGVHGRLKFKIKRWTRVVGNF